jgi:hypothetical protein
VRHSRGRGGGEGRGSYFVFLDMNTADSDMGDRTIEEICIEHHLPPKRERERSEERPEGQAYNRFAFFKFMTADISRVISSDELLLRIS